MSRGTTWASFTEALNKGKCWCISRILGDATFEERDFFIKNIVGDDAVVFQVKKRALKRFLRFSPTELECIAWLRNLQSISETLWKKSHTGLAALVSKAYLAATKKVGMPDTGHVIAYHFFKYAPWDANPADYGLALHDITRRDWVKEPWSFLEPVLERIKRTPFLCEEALSLWLTEVPRESARQLPEFISALTESLFLKRALVREIDLSRIRKIQSELGVLTKLLEPHMASPISG